MTIHQVLIFAQDLTGVALYSFLSVLLIGLTVATIVIFIKAVNVTIRKMSKD